MAGLTIYLASTDAECSGPLREALLAEGLPFAQDPTDGPTLVVSVVAADPWTRASELRTPNVSRVFVLCTGHIEPPPATGTDGIIVRHWSDAETAAMFVQQAFNTAQAELASTTAAESIPPPSLVIPSPAVGTEPEMLEDGALMSAEEPEVIDDVQLLMEPRLGAPPPPQMPARSAAPMVEEVSPEDMEFIQRVFNQVREADFRSPPPPPPRKALAGLDKKMQFLRDRNRELERDLARVGYIWSVKQRQVNIVEEVVAAKEAERATAVQRYNQIKEQATRASAQARIESDTMRTNLNDLEATKNGLEGQINKLRKESEQTIAALTTRANKEEQEKTNLIAEFRSKMEAAQAAFTQLRDASTARIADLEARLKATEEKLAATDQTYDEALATIAARDQTIAEQCQALSDRDSTIQKLSDEMAGLRADMEARIAELTRSLETEKADAAAKIVEVEGALATRQQELEQSRATTLERDATITQLNDTITQTRAELETRVSALDQELTATKTSRQGIQDRLVEREKTLSAVSEQISREGGQHEERVAELKLAVKSKDEQLETFEREVASAREEFHQLADEFAKHRDEAGRISEQLGQALADARAEARTTKDRVAELDREVKEWEARLADTQAQLEASQEEARVTKSDKDNLAGEATSARARAEELEREIAARDQALADARSSLEAAQQEARIAKTDAESIGQKLAELQAQQSGTTPT